jgi:hypothetical protein
MEHIFYYPCLPAPGLWVPAPGLWVPAPPFMDRILFAMKSDFSIRLKWDIEKICVFFHFISLPEHGFSILARKFVKFRPNLMSKIPCSKWLKLSFFPPILPQKCITSHRLCQKDCAQFHPCSPVHFIILSTKDQKKRFESYFISQNPGLLGLGVGGGFRFPVSSLVTNYCLYGLSVPYQWNRSAAIRQLPIPKLSQPESDNKNPGSAKDSGFMKFHSAIGTINQELLRYLSGHSRIAVSPYFHITVFLVAGFWLPFFLFSTLYTPRHGAEP